MLTKIDRADVPPSNRPRSPMRQVAFDSLREFLAEASTGEVFELTGFPDEGSRESADRLVGAVREEAHRLDGSRRAKVFRRRGRVFLEAVEPRPIRRPRAVGADGR